MRTRRKNALWAFLILAGLLTAPSIGALRSADGAAAEKNWEAVAPGLVEPQSGEIKIAPAAMGRISEVLVKAGDTVLAGEVLLRLDDEQARARLASAQAQAAMRKRTRDEQSAGRATDRRKAEDAAADAETALLNARDAFDRAAIAKRTGGGSDGDLAAARAALTAAEQAAAQKQAALHKIEAASDTPLPTQTEGALNVARAELRLALVELDNTAVRAPIASTVLQVNAKAGELAAPTAPRPLLSLGDVSALRVRAELDERDLGKVKLGNKVVVRTDAFPGREFAGKVAAIAPIVQAARITVPESRNLTDLNVAEVLIDLAEPGPLVVGMKVDAYFQREGAAQ